MTSCPMKAAVSASLVKRSIPRVSKTLTLIASYDIGGHSTLKIVTSVNKKSNRYNQQTYRTVCFHAR